MEQYTKKQLEEEGYKPAPAEYFTGQAWLKTLVIPDETTNCVISDVLFEPGTRNNWHTHPSNQILLIKEGTCYYQEEGKPVRHVEAGGVINILPGVKHWHGASPYAVMVHTAIGINTEKGIVNWLEAVSDATYAG
ncbi:cupin domain-containing protein [Chitinophaga ginsengisoli]|uniref:Quercetin dioxygenase-like cupin family protein n=1 Tax=Chitinophaga ginsengisoli TaxID=363837 RepID=A0A2P8G7W1_9BACT|nr:cupin domain-containing protein [Chitinophaga ginsengisoli]PSL30048.1 quercetin dioxygenase-like cupin family protein [Chitinophaga ginsengisoli]